MLTKRGQALAAALALLLGANAIAAPAEARCAGRCKAKPHKVRRGFHGEGRVLGEIPPPSPWPHSPDLPLPTAPERRYPTGVAPLSPFLPNNLPSTFLPQKL